METVIQEGGIMALFIAIWEFYTIFLSLAGLARRLQMPSASCWAANIHL
jgi:hypothetical protein